MFLAVRSGLYWTAEAKIILNWEEIIQLCVKEAYINSVLKVALILI
jgi:hypothetical protein